VAPPRGASHGRSNRPWPMAIHESRILDGLSFGPRLEALGTASAAREVPMRSVLRKRRGGPMRPANGGRRHGRRPCVHPTLSSRKGRDYVPRQEYRIS
jgi:hypothetical protein